MDGLRCSVASSEAHEPLAGTATDSIDRWILLEVNDPWAPEAIETEVFSQSVKAKLAKWGEEPRTRLQLVRRPGRVGKRRELIVVSSVAGKAQTSKAELEAYDDLVNLELSELPIAPAAPLWLVCVHGRRDRCCALHGSAVFRAMQSAGVEAWQTSHLGGHRFAACVLSLPEGFMYGRLRAEHVPALVAAHRARKLEIGFLRGRCSYDRPTQAAEIFLRKRLGTTDMDRLAWVGTSRESDATWRATFRVDEGEHAVLVTRERTSTRRPASCGAEPEPISKLVEK